MSYELKDGTEVTGDIERVMRTLDDIDPLADDSKLSLNSAETIAEFAVWRDDVLWCPGIRSLILSNGQDSFIEKEGDEYLYRLMQRFNEGRRMWAMNEIAKAAGEDKERLGSAKAYLKHVTKANDASQLRSAVSLFCKTRTIAASQLNREPTVIGTEVGVVDMDMGRLLTDMEGYEDDAKRWHVTKSCRGEVQSRFNQDPAYDERWDEFILEIMCGDKQRADYLQRALGYSMLGGNPEEVMFIAYGATTRNGKGTLLNTIAWVLGDYAANMPSDFLTRTKQRSSSDDDALGALDGVRFVTMSEPTAGRKLDEAKVKSLTGNDPITVARKYCPTTTFYPQFTMWLSCNRLPSVEDTTVFTSGRIRVIPFERHFEKAEQDSTLKNRFRTKDGAYTVLTWLIEGYEKWKRKGLAEPKSIVDATEIWAGSGGDDFQKFVDTECVIETSAKEKVRDICDAYKQWATDNDKENLTDKDIKARLKDRAIPSRKGAKGYFYFYGIALKEAPEKSGKESTSTPPKSTRGGARSSKTTPKSPKSTSKPTVKLGKKVEKGGVGGAKVD